MVARLKLKGIDGRAPPGVNATRIAAVTLLLKATREGWWAVPLGGGAGCCSSSVPPPINIASLASRGNTVKLRETRKAICYQASRESEPVARVMTSGMVKTQRMTPRTHARPKSTIRSQALRRVTRAMGAVQRLNVGGCAHTCVSTLKIESKLAWKHARVICARRTASRVCTVPWEPAA